MTIEVYADELLRLTVDDLGDEILVRIKDLENQTEEHLAHLRNLVEQRAGKDQSQPVNASELGDRLRRLSSRQQTPTSCSRSLSSTPSYDEEKENQGALLREQEAYEALVAEGAQPTHPIHLGFDVINNPGKYKQYQEILWFWHSTCGVFRCEFRAQLQKWRNFRQHQDRIRKFYVPRKRFQEYENLVRESQADLGSTWNLRVLENRHEQNRLEDWNEFRALYNRKLKAYQKTIEPAEQNLLLRKRTREEAQARLTDVIDDPQVLCDRVGEIVDSRREIAQANLRVQSAEKGLEVAKRNQSVRKTAIIKTAAQELRSAKVNLKHASGSEEMRRLRDGSELKSADHAVIVATAKLGKVQLDVERWEIFLRWIDDQYAAIAAESGYSTQDGAKDIPSQFFSGKDSLKRQKLRCPRKCTKKQSVLGPHSSSKITKPLKHEPTRYPRRISSSTPSAGNTTQHHPTENQSPRRRSQRVQQLKVDQVAQVPKSNVLNPVHSSKVTKGKAISHGTRERPMRHAYSAPKRTTGTKWNTSTVNNKNLRRSARIMAESIRV